MHISIYESENEHCSVETPARIHDQYLSNKCVNNRQENHSFSYCKHWSDGTYKKCCIIVNLLLFHHCVHVSKGKRIDASSFSQTDLSPADSLLGCSVQDKHLALDLLDKLQADNISAAESQVLEKRMHVIEL
jgi:hypothetical protein